VHRLRLLLTEESSPKRLALAFGVGAFVGPTPTVGLHTVTAIGLAWVLRLNKVVTIAGSNVANPWTMAFFLVLDVKVGAWLLGRSIPPLPQARAEVWPWVEPLILPAFVGCVPVGLLTALLSGGIAYAVARSWQRVRPTGSDRR
jgi:uncharacterized protein (DUF2062 family)